MVIFSNESEINFILLVVLIMLTLVFKCFQYPITIHVYDISLVLANNQGGKVHMFYWSKLY